MVTIDDVNFTADIDYSNVLLNGSSFRSTDNLTTDVAGISSSALISGWYGDPDYINYGNATLFPFPFICVECGYEMTLNLTANPLILSYYESNPYDTGEVNFELFVSQVPLPATVWLFGSGLIGLLGVGSRKRTYKAN
ncbi:MAG: PEP-CTERM sorting domain-containing protein [Gammaproteobacteria bacterium]|nr:PEP-CTERM sorting domain-containing protein [Gammaproteobacteria bacterium]